MNSFCKMNSFNYHTPCILKQSISFNSQSKIYCFASHHTLKQPKESRLLYRHSNILPVRCTSLLPWETSSTFATVDDIKGSNEDTSALPIPQSEVKIQELRNESSVLQQSLKWPMWILGPAALLVTGMLPTLWLPLSSVFLGPNTAGLLSLVGLDCLFNMGATLFLLMADACARPKNMNQMSLSQVPLTYRLWNILASLVGLLLPLAAVVFSRRGLLEPQLSFISFAVLLGPYYLLLSVQMLTEFLTWHWKSPVWLVTPVVYEGYRLLQLMRGLRLGTEIGAPSWAVAGIRVLVSWWVLILGVQLMRVAWFAGYASKIKEQN